MVRRGLDDSGSSGYVGGLSLETWFGFGVYEETLVSIP